MLTRCPNPRCKIVFEVPNDREGKNVPCSNCAQVITVRSLAVLEEIDRINQTRQNQKETRQHQKEVGQTFLSANGSQTEMSAPPFSALLEDIRSLWNVGSIFRSADGAGFGTLYLCGITGCPPRKEIAKTSLGAEDNVPWTYHTGALEILPSLIERGVQIVALEKTDNSELLDDALRRGALKPPLCLMVGNEVAGVSAEALSRANIVCNLPMRGMKTSLNVAVAFGIAAYTIRQSIPQ